MIGTKFIIPIYLADGTIKDYELFVSPDYLSEKIKTIDKLIRNFCEVYGPSRKNTTLFLSLEDYEALVWQYEKINIDKYMGMKIQITNGDSFVCFSDPRDEFLRRISEKYNKKNEK